MARVFPLQTMYGTISANLFFHLGKPRSFREKHQQ